MEDVIRVYDSNMKKVAYLQNAFDIGYELNLNTLWSAHFSLPAEDPKNIYCQPFNFVEIYDGKERVELFRIMRPRLSRGSKASITYDCEHVLGTLLDDVMYKYHQIGGGSIGTVAVLRYVLDRQTVGRWQLGSCDFDRRFEYKWENENLLGAMFSVPKVFDEKYRWEFDTTGSTWRINLKRMPTQFKADIMYRKNLVGIEKETDATTVVTRLYALGYGEGDNQLDIAGANGGVPYLEANTTTWGTKSSILVDRRFENAETLKAYARSLLDELKNPYVSYTVQAVDLHRKEPHKHERFFPGDIVRIVDKEDDIMQDLPIVKVRKKDLTGKPGAVEIEVANKSRNIAGSITDLFSRTRINELYAQGATNQMAINFADNCDPTHPAVLKLYIPEEMARINKCVLHYELEPFRGYSRGVASAPGETVSSADGGGRPVTSSEGGGSPATTEYSSTGIEVIVSPAQTRSDWLSDPIEPGVIQPSGQHFHAVIPEGTTDDKGLHGHSLLMRQHIHYASTQNNSHRHSVQIPSHQHQVNIPSHSHSVKIPAHTHEMEHGIYEGDMANAVGIEVDGTIIPAAQGDVDIIKYLATDSSGKITRGTWHTIKVIPDKMTRITANVFLQIFTNSRGGGDY